MANGTSRHPSGGARRSRQFLPLKPAWFQILLAVAGGHRHGYAIRQEVESRTEGRVRLWPATLYGALARLTEEGLLQEVEGDPKADADDPRRRYYRLTQLGRAVMEAETRRLESLIRLARRRLPAGEGGRA